MFSVRVSLTHTLVKELLPKCCLRPSTKFHAHRRAGKAPLGSERLARPGPEPYTANSRHGGNDTGSVSSDSPGRQRKEDETIERGT